MATLVSADLAFTLEREGREPVRGRLTGSANRLCLDVDDPGVFAGGPDAPAIRALAEQLAQRGIVLRVVDGDQHLVTLGLVSAPWWQRRATGSRRIRLGSLKGAWTAARARARGQGGVLPSPSMLPPTTLWPPAPTFARRDRRPRTTTHDPARGGAPRLVLVKQDVWEGERQPVFWLQDAVQGPGARAEGGPGAGGVVIGSAPDADIRLPDLEAVHAVVRHDDADEWVIEAVGGVTRVHGRPVFEPQVLRTGARVSVGPHVLSFRREEFADHGRPHGGRVGGEIGRQVPQAPRHEVQRPAEE